MDADFGSPTPDLFQSLTAAQLAAVRHIDGPLLILAGPGSGKTRVVTHRVANLLAYDIPDRSILALTFTNKAADEMKARLARIVPRHSVWMGTFHRFCARLLRQYGAAVGLTENFSIYDMEDARTLLVEAIADERIDLTHATPDSVAHAISWAKNSLLTPAEYQPKKGHPLGTIVERIYPAYQRRMLAANAVDFDDLLLHVATLLRENPDIRRRLDDRYRYILVDEYQDTNLAQYAIVRALSIDHPNLAVTGDPDQSIYGWRGANLSNILEFEKDFPSVNVVRLEQNYRSTKAILRVADELIRHNIRRKPKDLFTENPEGAPVRLYTYPNQRDEADDIAAQIARDLETGRRRARDVAIFYRTNALSRQIEHALRDHVVPYQIVNGLEFYQRKEIKDVLAYLHLLNNPRSEGHFRRIINVPTRKLGKASVGKLADYAQAHGLSLLEAARRAGLIEGLGKAATVAFAKFVAMYDRLGESLAGPVEALVGLVLSETGYREVLENSETEEDEDRLANLEELLTAAREFDIRHPTDGSLELFLEESSLVADSDAWESDLDKVTLMTMHAAKGLEFPVVYIVACENGLLPHERSLRDEQKLEEERRLLFVGLTRAKEELQLSYAQYRSFRGQNCPTVPSVFLMELPRHEMDQSESWGSRRHAPEVEEGFEPDAHELAGDDSQLADDADDFSPELFSQEDEPPRTKPGKPLPNLTSGLVTGEQLLARQTGPRFSPNQFKHGMVVEHPEYGPGTIIALSGEGAKRNAVVRFFSDDSERTFRLAMSNLAPAGA
ncbi:MAG: UvrD-helicase domain-containing protein [Pirellulaceae bacterium]|nr:UvrD-helicase domain-containing protein [Pirellulaceae bacterium]